MAVLVFRPVVETLVNLRMKAIEQYSNWVLFIMSLICA